MNNSHANKKDMFYIIILILTFITVIVGITFALYSLVFSQEEGSSAVYTGTLSIEYLSGKIIDYNFLYPIDNPSITAENNVYKNTFKVTNTGSLDTLLEIVVEFNQNEFSNNTLKYMLYNEEADELDSGYLAGRKTSILTSNLYLENNTTEEFTLMIWLQDNGENQNSEMLKELKGTIRVDASQKIE